MPVNYQLISEEFECSICGLNKRLEDHHIEHRSQAPARINDPTNIIRLCREHHDKFTNEEWEFEEIDEKGQQVIQVVDKSAKDRPVVWRRHVPPADWDPGAYFAAFNQLDQGFDLLESWVPYLTNEQLIQAFQLAATIEHRAWRIRATLIGEARARMNWGDITEAMEAIARAFGISRASAYDYLRIYREFRDTPFWALPEDVPVSAYVIASQTENPQRALDYYLDRKAEEPSFNTTVFKAELAKAVHEREEKGPICPNCGHDLQCRYCHASIWPLRFEPTPVER